MGGKLTQAVEQSLEARPTLAAFYTGRSISRPNFFLQAGKHTQAARQASWQTVNAVPLRVPQVRLKMDPSSMGLAAGSAETATMRRAKVVKNCMVDGLDRWVDEWICRLYCEDGEI
jgi:hypothetical protein